MVLLQPLLSLQKIILQGVGAINKKPHECEVIVIFIFLIITLNGFYWPIYIFLTDLIGKTNNTSNIKLN